MSCATVTSPYSSQAAHSNYQGCLLTEADFCINWFTGTFYSLSLLFPPFVPYVFVWKAGSFGHITQQCLPWGMCPWDMGWSCLDLGHCPLQLSHPSKSVFPRVLWDSLSSEIHCSKQSALDIFSFYLTSPHLFLHSSVFSSDVVCLSFHAEYEREISLFLT